MGGAWAEKNGAQSGLRQQLQQFSEGIALRFEFDTRLAWCCGKVQCRLPEGKGTRRSLALVGAALLEVSIGACCASMLPVAAPAREHG